jgi:regulator of cell morphogenesis and NO signaling
MKAEDLTSTELIELIERIVGEHHAFARMALERASALVAMERDSHASTLPGIDRIAALIAALRGDLLVHMIKEERVVFPYIVALERGEKTEAPFGTIARPVFVMRGEHAVIDRTFEELRALTGDFVPPRGASRSLIALCKTLDELERDLRLHMDLEDQILFPRAMELERLARTG